VVALIVVKDDEERVDVSKDVEEVLLLVGFDKKMLEVEDGGG